MARARFEPPFVSIDTLRKTAGYAHPMAVNTKIETYASSSAEQTQGVAASVAERLRSGDVVLLTGDLGAGKTTFVRGAARALGVEGRVTSPTFAIGNVYPAGSVGVAHVDLYRLDALDGSDEAVLDDYLDRHFVTFVEWPHHELFELESLRAVVALTHAGDDAREIEVRWRDGGEAT